MKNVAKRIFCYDFNIAEENKNGPHFKRMLIEIIIISSYIILGLITMALKDTEFILKYQPYFNVQTNPDIAIYYNIYSWILIITFGCFIYDFLVTQRKLNQRMTVFSIGEDGKVYEITKKNHADKNMAIGYYIGDKIDGKNDTPLAAIGLILGYVFSVKSTKSISTKLNHPDIVNMVLGDPKGLNDGNVYRIDKVYYVRDKGHYYLIKCDCYDCKKEKLYTHDDMILNKSYNCYDELVKYLESGANER